MRKIPGILLFGFLLLQAFTTVKVELSAEERKAASDYLKETRDYFTQHVKGLSDAQLEYKAGPDKWSIRQCMEHIALAESFINTLVENSMKQPPNPEKKAEIKYTTDDLKRMLVDRSKKGKAPEPIQPTGTFSNNEDIVKSFVTERNKHIEYLETTKDDMHAHIFAHPFFGMLDSYQWMFLISGHTKRHTLQIEEVMASPDFPKN